MPTTVFAAELRGCLLFAWLKFGKLALIIFDVSVGCVTSIAELLLLRHFPCKLPDYPNLPCIGIQQN